MCPSLCLEIVLRVPITGKKMAAVEMGIEGRGREKESEEGEEMKARKRSSNKLIGD